GSRRRAFATESSRAGSETFTLAATRVGEMPASVVAVDRCRASALWRLARTEAAVWGEVNASEPGAGAPTAALRKVTINSPLAWVANETARSQRTLPPVGSA